MFSFFVRFKLLSIKKASHPPHCFHFGKGRFFIRVAVFAYCSFHNLYCGTYTHVKAQLKKQVLHSEEQNIGFEVGERIVVLRQSHNQKKHFLVLQIT